MGTTFFRHRKTDNRGDALNKLAKGYRRGNQIIRHFEDGRKYTRNVQAEKVGGKPTGNHYVTIDKSEWYCRRTGKGDDLWETFHTDQLDTNSSHTPSA